MFPPAIGRMVRHGRVEICARIKPDFVATGSLAAEFEAAHPQFPDDLAITKPGQAAHLRSNYDGVVSPLTGCREVRNAVSFPSGVDQFPGNVTGDLKSF